MKRGIIFGSLLVFLVFATTKTTFAVFTFLPQFGGRIIETKAPEIEELEGSGFICPVIGSTISIMPIGSPTGTPTSYYIPSFINARTGTIPRGGQLIIGRYSGFSTVSCTHPYTGATVPVTLPSVNLFGTSRR